MKYQRPCYIRRKSDGKYLRGAILWRWTRFKKCAAKLEECSMRELFNSRLMKVRYDIELSDIEFIPRSKT